MWGQLRAGLVLGVLGSLVATWALPASAETAVTFADRFQSQSFSGNDGSAVFSGPWTEFGESNGPNAGPVYVWSDPHCAGGSGWCLKIGGDEVNIDGHGVIREADTSAATSATLSYSFRRVMFDDYEHREWVKVQVSGNGGNSWTTLARHKFNRNDAGDVTKQHDISDFIGSRTQIRVLGGPADTVEAYIYLDDFEIQLTMDSTSTTTTSTSTSTSTTTTTATTTTTLASPPNTSTTAPTTTTTQATSSGTTTTTTAPQHPVVATTSTTSTTTTMAVFGNGAEPSPAAPEGEISTGVPSTPGTYESFVSKTGLTVTDAMPAYYRPGDDTPGSSGGEATSRRTPVGGLMATFATTAETLRGHTVSAVVLGVLVAWLALRGLGRTRRRPAA